MAPQQLVSNVAWAPTGAIFAIWTMFLLASPSAAFELPSFLRSSLDVNRPTGATAYQANQPYDGLEYPLFGRFVFRPALFWLEGGVLGFCVLFVLIHYVGKTRNLQVASQIAAAALPTLEQEFAVVADDDGRGHLLWNGGNSALMFASGRRGCTRLYVTFDLIAQHDPMEILYTLAKDIVLASTASSFRDTVTFTFTLPPTSDNVSGVFALVNKGALQHTRSGRFDLTFAKVNDSDSAVTSRGLSNQWAIMSEASDLTDGFLGEPDQKGIAQRSKLGLTDVLEGQAGKFLDSLILTDQPFTRPTRLVPVDKRERLLILTLQLPKSRSDMSKAVELLQLGCNLVDALDKGVIKARSETLDKLRKTRAQVDKEIEEEATKEQREAEQEAREEAKRKAEKEKFDKLSPAEQAKRKEVERKRAMKKAGTKVR
ncbi:uncharacterized protein UHOD_02787 [Ustilago sp. UG-2017b]|nr:uncharacterized protein UHOD_02787 [Ustilago sp. UG-2017b]